MESVKIKCKTFITVRCRRATRVILWAIQNAKWPTFSGACSLDPIWEGLQCSPDFPAAQQFFSSLPLSKNWLPPKIAGYSTALEKWVIKLTGVFPFWKVCIALSSFRFFRFNMSLREPSGFRLINIDEMYSPVWCSHFFITTFAKSFWISKFMADSSSFQNWAM